MNNTASKFSPPGRKQRVCEGRISSPFGLRLDPVEKLWRDHNGVDIAAPVGTPVLSPVDGRVAGIYNHAAGGKTLIVASGCGKLRFGFCHLKEYKVRTGQRIKRGEQIASTGNSGRSTGPHLHFTVKIDGEWVGDEYTGGAFVNPEPYIEIGHE